MPSSNDWNSCRRDQPLPCAPPGAIDAPHTTASPSRLHVYPPRHMPKCRARQVAVRTRKDPPLVRHSLFWGWPGLDGLSMTHIFVTSTCHGTGRIHRKRPSNELGGAAEATHTSLTQNCVRRPPTHPRPQFPCYSRLKILFRAQIFVQTRTSAVWNALSEAQRNGGRGLSRTAYSERPNHVPRRHRTRPQPMLPTRSASRRIAAAGNSAGRPRGRTWNHGIHERRKTGNSLRCLASLLSHSETRFLADERRSAWQHVPRRLHATDGQLDGFIQPLRLRAQPALGIPWLRAFECSANCG